MNTGERVGNMETVNQVTAITGAGVLCVENMKPETDTAPGGEGYGKNDSGVENMDTPHSYTDQKTISSFLTIPEKRVITNPLVSGVDTIDEETIDEMYEFFYNAPKKREVYEIVYTKAGDVREIKKEIALPPPSYLDFCKAHGIRWKDFNFVKKNSEIFAEAVEECDQIVKAFIVEHGLLGNYASQFAVFAAKNLTDMKDKSEIENKTVDINKLLNQLDGSSGRKAPKIIDL